LLTAKHIWAVVDMQNDECWNEQNPVALSVVWVGDVGLHAGHLCEYVLLRMAFGVQFY